MTKIWTTLDTLAIAALVLMLGALAVIPTAEAQGIVCTTVGNRTYCDNSTGIRPLCPLGNC